MQDIRRQALIAIRWLPLVLIMAIAAGAVAYAYVGSQPDVYEATARLELDPGPNPTEADLAQSQAYRERLANQAESRLVSRSVIDKLGLAIDVSDLRDRIEATTDSDDLGLAVNVRGADPADARLIAEGIGNELQERATDLVVTDSIRLAEQGIQDNQDAIDRNTRRLDGLLSKTPKTPEERSEILSLQTINSSLREDILTLQASSRETVRNRLRWTQRPSVPEEPVEPRPLFWAILALVVGGMLAVAIGFIMEYLRDKIRDRHDLEMATGLTTVGSIAERRGDIRRGDPERLTMLRHPVGEGAEAYRDLRTRIALEVGSIQTMLVTGPDESDAHSVVAANLAIAFAESGRNVFLVDSAYRSPRLHAFFELPNEHGLAALAASQSVPLDVVTRPTAHPGLRVVTTGRVPVGVDLLALPQIPEIIGELLDVADMVIFDAPTMATSLDAAVLAKQVQASLLVIPQGSRGDAAAGAAHLLDSADAHLIGTVLYRVVRGSHERSAAGRPAIGPKRAQPRIEPTPPTIPNARPSSAAVTQQRSSPAPGGGFFIEAFFYRLVRAPGLRGIIRSATGSEAHRETKVIGPDPRNGTPPPPPADGTMGIPNAQPGANRTNGNGSTPPPRSTPVDIKQPDRTATPGKP